jgi:alcohol dehydrogenase
LNAEQRNVHLYGRHKDKLRIAERAGVKTELTRKKLPENAYDWVVDATGSADGLNLAVGMTRPRGTVFMKSTIHGSTQIDAAPVIVNELTMIGSRCGRFEPALKLLESRKVNVIDMISATMPLSEAPRAFRRASERGVLKVLLSAE